MTATAEAPPVAQASPDDARPELPARPAAALAVRGGDSSRALMAKIQYAKALADSGLLPAVYRKNPANVLYAVEYGDMLGLPAMAAITGIHIIDGKPTASAGLISALVRRAGHKLRVGYDAAKMLGWAEIVRADDPGYTFRSEWDLDRAVTAELCTIKDGKPFALDSKGRSLPWRKFYPSMTKHRAVTEVARDACEEALYGLHYTPEELGAQVDEDGVVLGEFVTDDQPVSTGDPWQVRSDEGVAWLAEATSRAATFADLDAGRALWKETAAHLKDGSITKADADHVAELLKARNEELAAADAEIVEGVVVEELDPDDPWAAKVADIQSQDDADAAEAELHHVYSQAAFGRDAYERISAAIRAKAASLDQGAAG